jgi:hypothetical protein
MKTRSMIMERGPLRIKGEQRLDDDELEASPVTYWLEVYDVPIPSTSSIARDKAEFEKLAVPTMQVYIKKVLEASLPFLLHED